MEEEEMIQILRGFKYPQVAVNIIKGQNNWGNFSNLGEQLGPLSVGSEIIVWAYYESRIY